MAICVNKNNQRVSWQQGLHIFPYAITFLPPGSFLLQLYSAFDDDLQGICSYSKVILFTTFAKINYSLREDKSFSLQG